MAMHVEPGSEKMAMIDGTSITVIKSLSPANDPEIRRSRKILLVLLCICLVLSGLSLIPQPHRIMIESNSSNVHRIILTVQILIPVLFYSFGIFVTLQYYYTGLRVFAWLSVISLVISALVSIGFFMFFINVVIDLVKTIGGPTDPAVAHFTVMLFTFVIICLTATITTIFIVKFTFKLAGLIDVNKRLATQEV